MEMKRHAVVVNVDATSGHVNLKLSGNPVGIKARDLVAGTGQTISAHSPFGCAVSVRRRNVKSGEGSHRRVWVEGVGADIYIADPGQHPDGFEAGKRAFAIHGAISVDVPLNSEGKPAEAERDLNFRYKLKAGVDARPRSSVACFVPYYQEDVPSNAMFLRQIGSTDGQSFTGIKWGDSGTSDRVHVGGGNFVEVTSTQVGEVLQTEVRPGRGVAFFRCRVECNASGKGAFTRAIATRAADGKVTFELK
ncbi:MAG: hypothetical protein IT290_07490 [Deltaproteobacteria bacterium]|nr:hypothetical protein [Deltaproteobacteria bacterium]